MSEPRAGEAMARRGPTMRANAAVLYEVGKPVVISWKAAIS